MHFYRLECDLSRASYDPDRSMHNDCLHSLMWEALCQTLNDAESGYFVVEAVVKKLRELRRRMQSDNAVPGELTDSPSEYRTLNHFLSRLHREALLCLQLTSRGLSKFSLPRRDLVLGFTATKCPAAT